MSQYCDINLRPVPPGLVTVVRFCQEKQIPLILGADTNAHSTNWGPDQNPRGDDFDDFINRNQLHILNDGLKPTYYHWVNNCRTKTFIDVTLLNTFASNKGLGGEWTVSDDETFSDHKMITFTATATPLPPRLTRNLRKMDWQLFRTEIEGEIIMRGGYADLHERADFLTRTIVNALDRQAPLTAPKKRFEPDWWTEELADFRGRIDKLSRRKRRRPEESAALAVLKDNYKHKIKEAKRESFRKFCSSPSSVSEMAGMVKALASAPNFSALIKTPTGDAPVTHEESHGNLPNHHFPAHTDAPPP